MKKILFLFSAVFFATFANAQRANIYPLLSGGTATMAATTTNAVIVGGVTNVIGNPGTSTNLAISVSEFENIGLTFRFVGVASTTNGNVSVLGYKSYDGGIIYEDNPSIVYRVSSSGAKTYTTNATVAVTSATHVAFGLENSAAGYVTNTVLEINLKSPKYGARQATQ